MSKRSVGRVMHRMFRKMEVVIRLGIMRVNKPLCRVAAPWLTVELGLVTVRLGGGWAPNRPTR